MRGTVHSRNGQLLGKVPKALRNAAQQRTHGRRASALSYDLGTALDTLQREASHLALPVCLFIKEKECHLPKTFSENCSTRRCTALQRMMSE